MQGQSLLVAPDQALESVTQPIGVPNHGSNLDQVRRHREGKFQSDNFTRLQLTAQGRSDAVLAELAGSAPVLGGYALAKN